VHMGVFGADLGSPKNASNESETRRGRPVGDAGGRASGSRRIRHVTVVTGSCGLRGDLSE
jgi:hypothetical protein